MTKMKDLLGHFEQEAARRAHEAHRVQLLAALLPMRDGFLSEADCARMDQTRARYLREYRRHDL
ncbi:MAG TPA: hypothetical protein VH852_05055, partial [Hyphomicrobium sp.]